jgi:hypothetical protein
MANFPTSLDTGSSLPNPSTGNNTNSPSHTGLHAAENAAIIAVETKLGTGSSTPVISTLLFGTGTGTSAWTQLTSSQLAASLSDETGTGSAVFATTPTLITPKVDTINESTPGNGTTIGGVNIKSGALTTANSTPPGSVVQMASTSTSAVATGTTTIPYDDTIPQNTEGDQYLSLAFIPKSATNTLIIESTVALSNSTGTLSLISALFQDTTANALSAGIGFQLTATAQVPVVVYYSMTAATTSSTTFKIRAGASGAGTTTLNGQSGARRFGGVNYSFLKITEVKV